MEKVFMAVCFVFYVLGIGLFIKLGVDLYNAQDVGCTFNYVHTNGEITTLTGKRL